MTHIQSNSSAHPPAPHDGRELDWRLLGGSAAGLVIVAGLIYIVLGWQFRSLQNRNERQREAAEVRDPMAVEEAAADVMPRIKRIGGPPLEGLEPVDSPNPWIHSGPTMPRQTSPDAARLQQTAWVDREKGIVQIPVDEAMRLMLAERRFKTRGEPRP
jgi:hypothetical protein